MLLRFIITLFFISYLKVYSQEKVPCDTIIISDSLYQFNSNDFGFNLNMTWKEKLTGPTTPNLITDHVRIIDNCLNFSVNYQCDRTGMILVTNGIEEQDSITGRTYLPLKFLVAQQKPCKKLHYETLYYSFSNIKSYYVKFDKLEGILRIR
jgi:hypothetical protein